VQTGSFPAGLGRWGHFDLSGNVSEWVLDSLVESANTRTETAQKEQLRTAYRFGVQRTFRQSRLGFRCVRP
jgi:formylglycine-generating enzyme required for sulfatase activity